MNATFIPGDKVQWEHGMTVYAGIVKSVSKNGKLFIRITWPVRDKYVCLELIKVRHATQNNPV